MFDQSDIKEIHEKQEHESAEIQQQREVAYAEITKQYNPFYNPDSMTPTSRNNVRGNPRNFPHPQNLFDPAQNNFNVFPNQFNFPPNPYQNPYTPPNPYNSHKNHSYGDNYDPSVPTRRWDSTPEVNQFQPSPSELDLFKSPYSQPVSRKNYEQSRKDDYDDTFSDSNYSKNRTNSYSKRYADQSSPSDSSTELHKNSKQNQGKGEVNLFKETIAEYAYEEQTRRQIYDHSRKSYRDNERHGNSKYNGPSTSSDYSNRQKSRDYDRSPYARNDYKRSDHRDSRRSDYYHDKEPRNRRR